MQSGALLTRRVTVRVQTPSGVVELGPWRVRPPTVRVVVAVLECAPLADPEGDDAARMAWDVLSTALAQWLPVAMFERLVQSPGFLTEYATSLVWSGTPEALGGDETPARKSESKLKLKAAAQSWQAVVADYRAVLHAADVWNELWPDFVLQSASLDRLRAKQSLGMLQAILAGKGSEDTFESIVDRSGWTVDHTMTDEEQLAALRRLQEQSGMDASGARPPVSL
ncbi:MAG TPA: hypothetical protein VGB53_00830 [Rubricoccaceae bacterium]|jgi:hypothetical protein